MPVLVIPAAGVLIVAGLALLLLIGWQQIANALSHLFPTWHIPGFGSLRGWITGHIADAYGEVAGYLDKYVAPMTQFVVAPFVVMTSMFTELGALDRAMYAFGTRIVTVTVPRAVAVLRGEAHALEARARAYAFTLTAAAEVYARSQALTVRGEAWAWALQSRAYAGQLEARAEAFAHAEVLAAQAQAVRLVGDVRAFAVRLYDDGAAFTRAQVAAAEASAAGLFRQAEVDMVRTLQRAEDYAQAAAAAAATSAVAGLTGALVTDLDVLWPVTVGAIDDVIDVAAGAFTDVVDDLRGLARDIPASLPAAIAATLAISIPLLRLAKDCTVPNCRNLSQFGREIQELFGLVEDGALLALLTAAATDPEGAADEVQAGLAGGMTALANGFADLIGVR